MDIHNSSVHRVPQKGAIERPGFRKAKERVRLLAPNNAPRNLAANGLTPFHSPDQIETALRNLPSYPLHPDVQSDHRQNELLQSTRAKHAIDAYTAQFLQPQAEERRNISALLGIDFYV